MFVFLLAAKMTGSQDPVKKSSLPVTSSSHNIQAAGEADVPPRHPSLKNSRHAAEPVDRVPLVVTEESRGCRTTGQRGFMNTAGTPRPPDTGSVMLLLHRDQWR